MTETIESTPKEKKTAPPRFDPFNNPGPAAEQEAEWLNNEFPGLNITPGQVRALISNHSRFQKSDSRQAARQAEAEDKQHEREARLARNQERKRQAEEKREKAEAARQEREAAKRAKAAEKEAKAAEKATEDSSEVSAAKAAAEGPKKVRKPRPSKVSPEAQESF